MFGVRKRVAVKLIFLFEKKKKKEKSLFCNPIGIAPTNYLTFYRFFNENLLKYI